MIWRGSWRSLVQQVLILLNNRLQLAMARALFTPDREAADTPFPHQARKITYAASKYIYLRYGCDISYSI